MLINVADSTTTFVNLFNFPMLNPNSALLTLTYLGAERAIPNYNVMGLAKASLEANVRYMANHSNTIFESNDAANSSTRGFSFSFW